MNPAELQRIARVAEERGDAALLEGREALAACWYRLSEEADDLCLLTLDLNDALSELVDALI